MGAAASPARPEVTARLAAFVTERRPGDVSAAARREVKRAVLDLLGVTVLGATEPAGVLARHHAEEEGARGPSAVIGGGVRLAPASAALANGTAGHALDYDDIGLGAGHVSVAVVPAALAAADLVDAAGADLVEALALGYEVASRMTRVHEDNTAGPYAYGFHKPSVYAVFGATAAVGRLLGLDAAALRQACGLVASQAGGLRVNFGTMAKPLHAGLANRAAVEAVLLVRRGFTASDVAVEGLNGWFDAICRKDGDLDRLIAGLDGPLAVEEGMLYKAYPCCGANHYAIDGVLTLMEEQGLSHEDVEEVEVTIESRYLEEVLVYPWPHTGLEGKFSLAYNVAAALVDRAVTVETFNDQHLPTLEPVRPRIRVSSRADISRRQALIRLRTTDGRELHRDHRTVRGSLEDPFSWDELAAKFTSTTANLLDPAGQAAVIDLCAHLDEGRRVRDLTDLVLGAGLAEAAVTEGPLLSSGSPS